MRRASLVALLGLFFLAAHAHAQGTSALRGVVVDAVSGKPVPAAVVIATSPALQGEQTAVTDDTGTFEITLLPPGAYALTVQSGDYQPFTKSNLELHLDQALKVKLSLAPAAVEASEVVVTADRPAIDQGSATTGVVVDRKKMEAIPYSSGAKSFEDVAYSAPGVHGDGLGLAIGGSTSPESNYVIDGVNVTGISVGGNDSGLLQNFVDEVNVETGGYLPEYGRSTGGILEVKTKSGGDEFHGEVFADVTPFQADRREVKQGGAAISAKRHQNFQSTLGFDLGGPIIKKKIWFFVGFAAIPDDWTVSRFINMQSEDPKTGQPVKDADGKPVFTRNNDLTRTYDASHREYQFISKLTFNITENNNLTVSFSGQPRTSEGAISSSANGDESTFLGRLTESKLDGSARWQSKLFNRQMLVEGIAAWHHVDSSFTAIDSMGQTGSYWNNYPGINWTTKQSLFKFEDDAPCKPQADGFDPCPVSQYSTGGPAFFSTPNQNRISATLKLTNYFSVFGHHALKYGIDWERSTFEHTKSYSGGVFAYQKNNASGSPYFQFYGQYGEADPKNPGRIFVAQSLHNTTATTSTAFFAQDSWNLFDRVTIAGGLRWEIQKLYGADPATGETQSTPAMSLANNFAPRVGVIYDWTGRGMSKAYFNYGRFYESIPLDMADRQFPSEKGVQENHDATQCTDPKDPRTCPLMHDQYGVGHDYKFIGASFTPVDPNIQGQYLSETVGGVQYQWHDWVGGADYTHRSLGQVIEDMSSDEGTTYFISNPGVNGALGYQSTQANGAVVLFPPPVRLYDAVTIHLSRPIDEHLNVAMTYTYASVRGNYGGLYKQDTGQLDPNISSDYDLTSLLPNRSGPFSGDIAHTVNLYGYYGFDLTPKWNLTTGASAFWRSGEPINFLGAHPIYGPNEAFVLPRGAGGRMPPIWNVDAQLIATYAITGNYKLSATWGVFNLFNQQQTTSVDDTWTYDSVLPVVGGKAPNTNYNNHAPSGDLVYLRNTDGKPATVNPNWGNATGYQAPLSMKFGLRLSF